jgi:hypothetical protein
VYKFRAEAVLRSVSPKRLVELWGKNNQLLGDEVVEAMGGVDDLSRRIGGGFWGNESSRRRDFRKLFYGEPATGHGEGRC